MLANWSWSWLSIPLLISFLGWICTFLFKAFDSHRVFKIKRYELIHNCFKDSDLASTKFIVENTIKSIYKINIKFEKIVQLFENKNSLELFNMYRQSIKFIIFNENGVKMEKEYTLLDSFIFSVVYFFKYLGLCLLTTVSFYIFYYTYDAGLFNVGFYTYNLVWALMSIVCGILLIKVTFDWLSNMSSIRKAKEFVQLYNDGLTTIIHKNIFTKYSRPS